MEMERRYIDEHFGEVRSQLGEKLRHFLVEVVEVVLEAFLEVVLQEVAEVVVDVLEVEVSTIAYAKDASADAPLG